MAHILIVDDEPLNTELASVVCLAAGHTVEIAYEGRQALDLIARAAAQGRRFDLLLLDVLMPVMDGLTLTERLRAGDEYRDAPIVGITARAAEADLARCLAAGMTQVLTKPFRHKELRAVLDAFVGHRDADAGGVVTIERGGNALEEAEERWGMEA